MGQWAFNEANPSSVWTNPNQGDQFNNDDVGLGEALVREVIQNSTDAGEGNESVKSTIPNIKIAGARRFGDTQIAANRLNLILKNAK